MEINQSKKIPKKKNWKKIVFFIVVVLIFLLWASLTKAGYIPNFLSIKFLDSSSGSRLRESRCFTDENGETVCALKPIIYLYPKQKENIIVQLNYNGKIIADYPTFNENLKGWYVTAYPDGKIINYADNQEYSYLFWEGEFKEKINWDLSKGFIVRGKDTKKFLQKALSQMGLLPKEYNEFIVYWYPLMQNNKYNLIHFADREYTNNVQLKIIPKPDSILRVFMVYKSLEKPIEIEEQKIRSFERKGFTVIEWGGTKVE